MRPAANTPSVSRAFAHLNDQQLQSLFRVTGRQMLSTRSKAIVTELLGRGYFLDTYYQDFVTYDQWTLRYGEAPTATSLAHER
jgi:hypothetical protein